ncbi:NUDIX domain-containing protein [Wenxinia marina]|uniref:ADP-ribose pyrophosphatase n=1 Tax=Wenxinia marina DSM 24838 TaxID=1123501 RepID=A0A0D0NGZ2_9RHOB|nr:NUDIX domain-containing protein [Wenxinia marina]KIQ67605.1 ADP-ribose pyrophosphatase [Wenxinia marina DSM 24838]GGL68113.1 hypothetical protein GCM10011392_23260 [Wenxinia marina]
MRVLSRPLLRGAMWGFRLCRRSVWFFTRPETRGAHVIARTPEGEVVLVRLTYAKGWRLPGGGIDAGETAEAAALRELREEIGLTGHGAVTHLGEIHHRPDFRRGIAQVFEVRDVRYAPPRVSLEIEEVRAFPPDALPPDMPDITTRQLAMAGLSPPG